MLVMVVFFIAFRWIHLSTPLIRLFLLVLILLLMPRSEERFSRNAETDLVCRLLLEKKKRLALHSNTIIDQIPPQNINMGSVTHFTDGNSYLSRQNRLSMTVL